MASHLNVQGVSLFEGTPSTESAKGYKPSEHPGPAARELEAKKVLKGYQGVVDLTPAMNTGNEVAVEECLFETEKLTETFRETRRLFLSTRVSDLLVVS